MGIITKCSVTNEKKVDKKFFCKLYRTSETSPHLPYSPDCVPCDFFLFPQIEKELKGKRFDKDENLTRAAQAVAETIPKTDYKKSFQSWQIVCNVA